MTGSESPFASVHTFICLGTYATLGCTCGLEEQRRTQGLCPACGASFTSCDDCEPRPEGE